MGVAFLVAAETPGLEQPINITYEYHTDDHAKSILSKAHVVFHAAASPEIENSERTTDSLSEGKHAPSLSLTNKNVWVTGSDSAGSLVWLDLVTCCSPRCRSNRGRAKELSTLSSQLCYGLHSSSISRAEQSIYSPPRSGGGKTRTQPQFLSSHIQEIAETASSVCTMFRSVILLVATLLVPFAIANPLLRVAPRDVCPAVNLLVGVVGASSSASAFCSSYLHLGTESVTTTTVYR